MALHNEQGIAATSLKQIAQRADVSIGAAYHHFPTYDEAIIACGAQNFATHPLPHPSIFRGVDSARQRLLLLTRELFAVYAAIPGLASAYAERGRFTILEQVLASLDRGIETLLRAALSPEALEEAARPAALALLSDAFYRRLAADGLSLDRAAAEAAALIAARLSLTDKENA